MDPCSEHTGLIISQIISQSWVNGGKQAWKITNKESEGKIKTDKSCATSNWELKTDRWAFIVKHVGFVLETSFLDTHRWRSGYSWCWRFQSHWWPCRCTFPHHRSPPLWLSDPVVKSWTWSSPCGCYGRLWSTKWAAEGRPLQDRAASGYGRGGCFDDGSHVLTPLEDLEQTREGFFNFYKW